VAVEPKWRLDGLDTTILMSVLLLHLNHEDGLDTTILMSVLLLHLNHEDGLDTTILMSVLLLHLNHEDGLALTGSEWVPLHRCAVAAGRPAETVFSRFLLYCMNGLNPPRGDRGKLPTPCYFCRMVSAGSSSASAEREGW
jgi:hypothetical protein